MTDTELEEWLKHQYRLMYYSYLTIVSCTTAETLESKIRYRNAVLEHMERIDRTVDFHAGTVTLTASKTQQACFELSQTCYNLV